jgi:pyridoxine 4-dehydrogenase
MAMKKVSLLLWAVGAEAFVITMKEPSALPPTVLHAEAASTSRREFLAATTGFIAGSAVLSIPSSSSAAAAAEQLGGQIDLPPMGLGAWAWGDALFWGYDKKEDDVLNRVFDYAIQNSKSATTLLDTAEIYGFGRSEKLIGEFSKGYDPAKIQVATKFAAFPFRTKASDVVKACEESTKRLGRPIDLYQIHFPNAWSNAEYWDGIAQCYDTGLVKAVGVSNYGVDAVRACHAALADRGIQLATNQIQLSLLYRWPLENGLMQACEDLGVKVLSYSPLAFGLLTGKYTLGAPPQGPRKKIYEKLLTTPDYENLLATMKDVAEGHKGATLAQVALNWARAKNSVPIPGARTVRQVQSNYGALDWKLSKEEVAVLDKASAKVTTFNTPDMLPFPKKDIKTGLVLFDS